MVWKDFSLEQLEECHLRGEKSLNQPMCHGLTELIRQGVPLRYMHPLILHLFDLTSSDTETEY